MIQNGSELQTFFEDSSREWYAPPVRLIDGYCLCPEPAARCVPGQIMSHLLHKWLNRRPVHKGKIFVPFFFNIKFGMVHCWGDCNLGDGLYVLCVSLHVLPCTCVSPPPWFASVYQHGDRACSFTPVSMCVSVPGVSVCGGCFSCGWTGLMVCLHPLKFRGIYSPRVVQRVDPLLR